MILKTTIVSVFSAYLKKGARLNASLKFSQRAGLGIHWGGNSQIFAGSYSALDSSQRNGIANMIAPNASTQKIRIRPGLIWNLGFGLLCVWTCQSVAGRVAFAIRAFS